MKPPNGIFIGFLSKKRGPTGDPFRLNHPLLVSTKIIAIHHWTPPRVPVPVLCPKNLHPKWFWGVFHLRNWKKKPGIHGRHVPKNVHIPRVFSGPMPPSHLFHGLHFTPSQSQGYTKSRNPMEGWILLHLVLVSNSSSKFNVIYQWIPWLFLVYHNDFCKNKPGCRVVYWSWSLKRTSNSLI